MGNDLKRRRVVDPAVADILSDLERRKKLASLPKNLQAKARKDAARHKVGLDLPPRLHDALREIAEDEHISVSSLVTFYVWKGVEEHRAGRADLSPYKRISRCARFEYVIDLGKLENG